MSKKYKIAFFILLGIGVGLFTMLYLANADIAVLNPKGIIADKQRDLLIIATMLAMFIVIPVFALTFFIAWRYRESNHKAKYTPEWDHNRSMETVWWSIPIVFIVGLSIITWVSSHDLDPFKPLAANSKPVTIQVVALEWKWLFIYPEQGVASVNYLQFPEKTPINFEITADAPMNSFWIPQLGGQVYAMAGMSTKLHLMASETGKFKGSSANLSGEGFAGMKFTAESATQSDFQAWVQNIRATGEDLSQAKYADLRKPSKNNTPSYYANASRDQYEAIIMKYMQPASHIPGAFQTNMKHGAMYE